jgi:hypothetical protein
MGLAQGKKVVLRRESSKMLSPVEGCVRVCVTMCGSGCVTNRKRDIDAVQR